MVSSFFWEKKRRTNDVIISLSSGNALILDKSKKNCRLGGEWPGLTKDKIVAVLPTRRLDVSSKDTFCITITTLAVYKNMSGRLYGF